MAKKTNTLTDDVQNVHRSIAMANFAAGAAESSTTRDKAAVQKQIDAGKENLLITLKALVGIDIYEPDPKKTSAITYGGALIKGKETPSLLDEANASAQSNAIVNAHEAMERFIKAVASKFMYAKRKIVPVHKNDKKKAKNRFGKKLAAESTPQYFEQIVGQIASRNCHELFKMLNKYVSELESRSTKGHYGNYADIHDAVEFIRHSHTHSNGRFDENDLTDHPAQSQKIIKACVRRSVIHKDDRILPTHDQVSKLLAREAEFCQIIYDAISNELDMSVDYTPN
jgi:hypothetical protein